MDFKEPTQYALIEEPVERIRAISAGIADALLWVQEVTKIRDAAIVDLYGTTTMTSKELAKTIGMSRGRLYSILDRLDYDQKFFDWNAGRERNLKTSEKIEELRRLYPLRNSATQ